MQEKVSCIFLWLNFCCSLLNQHVCAIICLPATTYSFSLYFGKWKIEYTCIKSSSRKQLKFLCTETRCFCVFIDFATSCQGCDAIWVKFIDLGFWRIAASVYEFHVMQTFLTKHLFFCRKIANSQQWRRTGITDFQNRFEEKQRISSCF